MTTNDGSTSLRVLQSRSFSPSLFLTRALRRLVFAAYCRGWLDARSLARWFRRLPLGPEARP